jgi:hypothetical protein
MQAKSDHNRPHFYALTVQKAEQALLSAQDAG